MEQFFPTPEEVADLIKKSGGKVFIPHIFEYGDRAKEILNGLLKTIYIDGIECFYSKFTVEQRNRISEFARENNFKKIILCTYARFDIANIFYQKRGFHLKEKIDDELWQEKRL